MTVLVGVGGSDDALSALEWALERTAADERLVVAVLENPESGRSREETRAAVDDVLAAHDRRVEVRQLSGDPGSRIVEVAETESVDQLVLGGGEQSPMGKIRLGQIAEFVLVHARVPVTLVR